MKNNNEYNQNIQQEIKEKKKNPIIFIIIGILILAVGIGCYFLLIKPVSAKTVKDKSIDFIFNKITKIEDDLLDNMIFDYNNQKISEEGTLSFDIKSNDKNQVPDNMSNIKFKYNINLDTKGKQILINTTTNQNSKDIINLNAFLNNNIVYLNSDLFNNTYKINIEDQFNWEMISFDQDTKEQINAIKRITRKAQKILKESIKDEYLKQTSGKFTIDGKTIKGLKTSLIITEKIENKISINLLEKIYADEKLLKDLLNLSQDKMSVAELKEKIKNKINSIKEYNANDDVTGEINIFTTNRGKFLGLQIKSSNDENILKDTITAIKDKDEIIIKSISDEETIEFTYNTKNNELKTKDFSIKFLEKGIEFKYEKNNSLLDIKLTNKIEGKELTSNVEAYIKYTDENNTYIEIKLNCDNKTKEISDIKSFDTSKAKDIEEITEEELEEILKNFEDKSKETFMEEFYNVLDSIKNKQLMVTEKNII